MTRSFTNRVLGGVFGGLGGSRPSAVWGLRGLWVLFSIVSLGAGVLLYVALWWVMPQESLVSERRRGQPLVGLLVIGLTVSVIAAWIGQQTGQLVTESGQSLYWPVLLTLLGAVYALRQVWRPA